jgi:hypothetical protein
MIYISWLVLVLLLLLHMACINKRLASKQSVALLVGWLVGWFDLSFWGVLIRC